MMAIPLNKLGLNIYLWIFLFWGKRLKMSKKQGKINLYASTLTKFLVLTLTQKYPKRKKKVFDDPIKGKIKTRVEQYIAYNTSKKPNLV